MNVFTRAGEKAFHGALFTNNGSPWENARDPFSPGRLLWENNDMVSSSPDHFASKGQTSHRISNTARSFVIGSDTPTHATGKG